MIFSLTIKNVPLFTLQAKLYNIRLRKKCFGDPFETCSPIMSLFTLWPFSVDKKEEVLEFE